MRTILQKSLMLMLLSSSICSGAAESISNDDYDFLYMANKEFDRIDANKDESLSTYDLDLIKYNAPRRQAAALLKSQGAESLTRDEYIKAYKILDVDLDANVESNIVYKMVGDRRLMMDLYRPKDSAGSNVPVVMFLHGGGWFAGDKHLVKSGAHFKVLNHLLENGIAVAAVNYRLVDDKSTHVEDCVVDVKDALAFLNREADDLLLDRDRMVVWGGSAGAHLTMMLGFSDLDDFPSDDELFGYRMKPITLVSWYGAGSFEVGDATADTEELKEFHKHFTNSDKWSDRRDKAAQISPIRYIDSEDPSIMLMNGDKDMIVEVTQTYGLHSTLDRAGVENRMVVVKNSEHSWVGVDKDPDLDGICRITAEYIIEKIGAVK